jgi:hypothetical protein
VLVTFLRGARQRTGWLVTASVLCFGLAMPACASALYLLDTGPEASQDLVGLKTTDGGRITDADCRPQGESFTIIASDINSALWSCYVSDSKSFVYDVTAHVPTDVKADEIDKLTVLHCWQEYSNAPCLHAPKIVLPTQWVAKAASDDFDAPVYQETAPLVDRQLMALKTTDHIRIRHADCRPLTWHWGVQHGLIYGYMWTCYVSDGLNRVYNVNAHVRDTKSVGLDKLTVLNCWDTSSKFKCPSGTKIVDPEAEAEAKARAEAKAKAKAESERKCHPVHGVKASGTPAANSFAIARVQEALANLVEVVQPHPLKLVTGCAQKSKQQWLCVTYSTSVASRITPAIVIKAQTDSSSETVWGTDYLLKRNGGLQPCTATNPRHSTGSGGGTLAQLVGTGGVIPEGQKVGQLTFYSATSKTD